MPRFEELSKSKAFETFSEVEGEPEPIWHQVPGCKLMSFNAYLGAVPIAKALNEGAQIVVTGMLRAALS